MAQSRARTAACVVMVMLLASAAVAQLTPAYKPAEVTAPPASVRASDTADLYDIDAGGTDIRHVLEMLARNSGVNIVVSPEVTGQVDAHLKRMSVDDILGFLSTAAGFKYQKSGDTYVVGSKEKLDKPSDPGAKPDVVTKQEEPEAETLIWNCRHATPADLVVMLTKLFPQIQCAEGPGSTTPELDVSSSGLGGAHAAAGSSGGMKRSNSSTVVLIGSPASIGKARAVLTKLDVPRKQVAIDVTITEISSSGSKDLGIEWSWNELGLTEKNDSGIGFGKFTKQGMSITGALSALIKDGKATLLAQPNISVLDGECADILIGDRILYPKLVGYNQIGSPIYDKAEEKVGIYLQIAPKVAGEQEIVLTLYPQVSLVTGYLKTQAGDYPQISTREARTTVSVKSGMTLAIGGLLRSNELNSASKFPFLADIPIIGHAFRQNKKTKERTEIVILLSPRIVGEAAGQTNSAPIPNSQLPIPSSNRGGS